MYSNLCLYLCMAKKISFILDLEGGDKMVSTLSELKLDYKELTSELKLVEQGIAAFRTGNKDAVDDMERNGITLDQLTAKHKKLTAEQLDLSDAMSRTNRDIKDQQKLFDNTARQVPTESLIGLRRQYRELRQEIDSMDKAARSSTEGLAKITQAKKIKDEINEIGKSVGDFREQVGSYVDAIGQFFQGKGGKGGGGLDSLGLGGFTDFLNPLGAGGAGAAGGFLNVASQLVSKLGPIGTAIGAGIAGLAAGAEYVLSITKEYEKLNQVAGTLFQIDGQNLSNAVVTAKTISDIYNAEFEDVARAAQSVSLAFGSDVNKTLDLIKTGFAAGADLNKEFLESAREYPRLIQEAGASQEQFVELLIKSTKEGIYSDKGIDVVKEGALRLREQTKATKDALTGAFGKSFSDNLLKEINNGSITVFNAMQKVSEKLTEVDLTAAQTGTVIADVFGGPGEDAGLAFIKLLKDVDGDLSDVVNTTDAYTQRQNQLFDATMRVNTAQQELAAQFAGAGVNLDTLGLKAKAFATETLNDILKTSRAINDVFSRQGVFKGLGAVGSLILPGGNSADLEASKALLDAQDKLAFRQVSEGEKKAAADRLKLNQQGANGAQGLREEQARLKAEIEDAAAKGQPYKNLLTEYNAVTDRLAKVTGVLNERIKTTTKTVQEAAPGSIAFLQKTISELETKAKNSANPDQFIETINQKQQELKTLQDAYNAKTSEGQKKAAEDALQIARQNKELVALTTIQDEEKLQQELTKIRLQYDLDLLNQRLKLSKEGSVERATLEADVFRKQSELDANAASITETNRRNSIEYVKAYAESTARQISKSEEELQARINIIQATAEQERLRLQLDSTKLSAEKRLEIENQLAESITKTKKLQNELALVDPLADINTREQQALTKLSTGAVGADSNVLEQLEKKKTEIVLAYELERLQLRRDQQIKAGEETINIDREIADKQLEIYQTANEQKLAQQAQFNEEAMGIQVDMLGQLGEAFGSFLTGAEKDQKEFSKKILLIVLDAVEKTTNLYIAQLFAKQIAEKSFAGLATAAILTALVKAAVGTAKSKISKSEQGNILKAGGMFVGARHSAGGIKFAVGNDLHEAEDGEAIINRRSTSKFRHLLSAINSYKGWGKRFETGAVIGSTVTAIPGSTLSIDPGSMALFADVVGSRVASIVDTIVDRVIVGMDKDSRLKERLNAAVKQL